MAFLQTGYVVRAWSLSEGCYVTLSEHPIDQLEAAVDKIDELAGRADDDWHHIELARATFEAIEVRARPEGMRRKRDT